MNPFVDAGIYLIQIATAFYVPLVMLRFLMQWVRADFYNPLSQFIVKITNPLLRPLRRIIPSIFGFDTASLFLALTLQWLALVFITLLLGQLSVGDWGVLVLWAATGLLGLLLKIYFIAILLLVIMSWLSPGTYNPVTMLVYQLTNPLMSRVRRYIPSMGGLDFSPMVVWVAIGLLDRLIIAPLSSALGIPPGLIFGL